MKTSFLRLWEEMNGGPEQPLQTSDDEAPSKGMQVIRTGLSLSPAQGGFWDAFIQVCNNTEGMADLLEIRPDQISKFTAKIRSLSQEAKARPQGGQEVKKVLPTGTGDPSNQETSA